MRSLRSSLAALLVLALGACTLGPDYVRPAAEAPTGYKEAEGWKPAQPKDQLPKGEWWRVFDDARLDALETQVAVSNETVKNFAARVEQARALTAQARAAFFPAVNGSASATRSSSAASSRSASASAGAGAPGGPSNFYNMALDANWELDLWGRVRRNVESNEAATQASVADLENAKLSAQGELATDYLLLRVQDAQIRLLETTVAAYEKSLTLTRNQYAAGIVSRGDVVQAETQYKSTQAQALDARIQRQQLEHAIAILIGKPPAELSIAAEQNVGSFPAIPLGVPSELLERRPDIAAAERRVAAANAQIGVAEAAFFPTLTLSASGGFAASSFANWLTLPARYWSLGPALVAQTIFDAGLRSAQKAQAVALYDETVATYRQTVLTGFQEVEDNLVALRVLADEEGVQDDAVKAAREAVTIANNQYRAGTINYLAVVVLQAAMLNNERAALAIRARRLAASVGLIKALGGGWEATALAQQ
jgi:NodT family efflux transporter outer membrane factor (OMF) lipoprotein